jgi:hypothetical protein
MLQLIALFQKAKNGGQAPQALPSPATGARLPTGLPYPAGDWWRAVVVTGYMTGWRISGILGLLMEGLDQKDDRLGHSGKPRISL